MNKIFAGGLGVIAVLALAAVLTSGFGLSGSSVTGAASSSGQSGGIVEIPLSDITENAKFYEYDSIRFFAVKASDGTIKTGFDACDVCHASRKGYRQEGDYMICNNCGNRYPITGLGTENQNPGGCWPGYLPSTIDGDNLVIKESDIEAGAWRF
ncbi:MAG: DUF2318 domain-containing protein [Candidatus Aenigmatarchaeota archaeon]|nr:MAG: DUF2318 domain-containing protein [Candidatus Aenigmarchaeota archaeon]